MHAWCQFGCDTKIAGLSQGKQLGSSELVGDRAGGTRCPGRMAGPFLSLPHGPVGMDLASVYNGFLGQPQNEPPGTGFS